MDRGGFEPPKSKTSDLQSDPFGRSGICPLLRCAFFKSCGAGDWNRTHNLLITNQLLCQLSYTGMPWCLKVESNRRQRDFQSLALPTELSRHLATQTRLELVTSSVTGWRSNQLSYWAVATKQTSFAQRLFIIKYFSSFVKRFAVLFAPFLQKNYLRRLICACGGKDKR